MLPPPPPPPPPSLPSMDQIIAEPTYFAGGTYTSLLDHIYIQNCTIFMWGVLDTYYSDHDAIFADIALHGYQQWVPQLTRSGLKGDLYVILDINYWPHFCPLVQPFGFFFFFLFFFCFFSKVRVGAKRAVVIIGRWLLPSLVDTGDICCHYWQHILVPICF